MRVTADYPVRHGCRSVREAAFSGTTPNADAPAPPSIRVSGLRLYPTRVLITLAYTCNGDMMAARGISNFRQPPW